MVTFILVLPDLDGVIVDNADSPGELDYGRARPYSYFEVCARYEPERNAGGPCHCIARVNLEGCKDYDDDFAWAVSEVCRELSQGYEFGEFADPAALSDGPAVDIGYDCATCDCCGDDCDDGNGLCDKCRCGDCAGCRDIYESPE